MSSKYSSSVYKDLGGDEEPVDFDFFDDGASDKREYQSNKPRRSTLATKQTSASTSYSPRSTDLESARSAASSRSSLNVRLPSASPSPGDVVSDESDTDNYRRKRSDSKQTHSDLSLPYSHNINSQTNESRTKYERPKTCKPGLRSRKPETISTKVDQSSSSSDSGSNTSDSSYSSDFGSGGSSSATDSDDSDTDSGSVTDVSPLQSPNSPDHLKNFSSGDKNVQERLKSAENTKLNVRERHHSEGSIRKLKKESVRFADVNGHKAPPGRQWNESEAQELSMLLKAVLEMEETPKTLLQMGRQRSRPTSATSTTSNASIKSQPNKRMNMSFSNERVRQIDRDNQRLLQRIINHSGVQLNRAKTKPKKIVTSKAASSANGMHKPVLSHSAMRRQREQRRIEIENMQILKRIDSAKPCRDVTKEVLMEDHYKLTRYAQQFSKSPIRPTSAKSTFGKQSTSEAASRSSSRPTSAKKPSFRPSTGQRKQAWDDDW